MALEDRSKKELAQMVRDLQDKLIEMKPVESALTSQLSELNSHAIGLTKDERGNLSLVHIKYDLEKNAAAIEKLTSLESFDYAIADFKLKQFVAEVIVRKTRGGKYD